MYKSVVALTVLLSSSFLLFYRSIAAGAHTTQYTSRVKQRQKMNGRNVKRCRGQKKARALITVVEERLHSKEVDMHTAPGIGSSKEPGTPCRRQQPPWVLQAQTVSIELSSEPTPSAANILNVLIPSCG